MSDLPYQTENDLLAQRASAQQFVDAGIATDAGTVAALVHMAATWPDLQPGAVLGYAQSGYTADSPEVAAAAQVATGLKTTTVQGARRQVKTWGDFLKLPADQQRQTFTDNPDLLNDFKRWVAAGGEPRYTKADVEGRGFLGGGLHALGSAAGAVTSGLGEAIHQLPYAATHGGQLDTGTAPQAGLITVLPGGSTIEHGGEAAVRTGALAASYPLQLAQGAVREIAGGHNPLNALQPGAENTRLNEQTQVGQAMKALAGGNRVDVGAGLLPDPNSATAKAAANAARAAAPTIGGHAFTLGRYVGSQVFEPNSTPYKLFSGLIDAGVALKADPTYFAGKTIAEARAANALFPVEGLTEEQQALRAEYGLSTSSTRPMVDDQKLSAALGSAKWSRNVAKFVEKTPDNPSALLRASKYQIPDVAVADRLASAAAQGADEFNAVIADYRNTAVTPGAVTYHPTQAAGTRLTTMLSPAHIDPSDRLGTVKAMEQTLTASHVPITARDTVINGYIRASSRDEVGAAVQAWEDTMVERAVASGVPRATARQALGIHTQTIDGLRLYDYDTLTNGERWRVGMPVVGTNIEPQPSLQSELLQNLLELPDRRTISRLTSGLAPLYTFSVGNFNPYETAIDSVAGRAVSVFKGAVLARAGLMTKFLAEAQILGASYGINTWNHPLQWLGAVIADREGVLARAVDKLGADPNYLSDLNGQSLVEDGIGAQLYKSWSEHTDPAQYSTAGFLPIPRTHPQAATAYAEELGRMANDIITRQYARLGNTGATVDWLMHDTEGQTVLRQLQSRWDNINAFNMQRLANGEIDAIHGGPVDLTTRAGVTTYVDQHHAARFADWTSGNPDAIEAVAHRRLGGIDIYGARGVTKQATQAAQDLLDQGIGPNSIKARLGLTVPASQAAKRGLYDKVTQGLYHGLVSVPDSTLNKIPAWRQLYWKYAEELLPYVEPADHAAFLARAEDAALPEETLTRLQSKPLYGGEGNRVSLSEINDIAKHRAASALPKMTHDLMNTSQLGDMLRLIVPFGDAFRKIATRWGQALAENPQLLRRAQQGIEAARAPGSAIVSQMLGDPVPAGQGFFHKDPNGQEVWTLPGSTYIDKALLGVPIPLTSNVAGLNMVSQGYPSLSGPALSIPASYLRQAIPALQGADSILFPFGVPQNEGLPEQALKQFTPTWAQNLLQGAGLLKGPADERAFAQTFNSLMKNLASSGDYDLVGPNAQTETQRLVNDARDDARWLYIVRGVTSNLAPAAVHAEDVVKDPTGHLAILKVVQDAYQKQVKKSGPDAAMDWLIKTYGPNNIFIPQAASTPIGYGVPTTKAGQAWAESHPDIKATYPTTYGLFAPSTGPFDPNAFTDQFSTGERQSLSPVQQIAAAENRVGQWLYYKQRDKLTGAHPQHPTLSKAEQAALADYKTTLEDSLPGFNTFEASPYDQSKKRASAIRELIAASTDPRLTSTPASEGLGLYLQARQVAISEAHTLKLKTPFTSPKAAAQRDYLRSVADAIVRRYPDFGPMWDLVFSREMTAN